MFLNDGGYFRIEICLVAGHFGLLLSECLSAFGIKPLSNVISWVLLWEVVEVFGPFAHFYLL